MAESETWRLWLHAYTNYYPGILFSLLQSCLWCEHYCVTTWSILVWLNYIFTVQSILFSLCRSFLILIPQLPWGEMPDYYIIMHLITFSFGAAFPFLIIGLWLFLNTLEEILLRNIQLCIDDQRLFYSQAYSQPISRWEFSQQTTIELWSPFIIHLDFVGWNEQNFT